MKNLDKIGCFIDPVVDQNWGVHELADSGPSVHPTADIWEASQKIDVVEDGLAEPFGGGCKLAQEYARICSKSASAASVIRIWKST